MYSSALGLFLTIQYASSAVRHARNFTAYIINGVAVNSTQYPHMALFYNDGKTCGGTILNSFTIVTAAHCISFNYIPERMSVVLGVTLMSEVETTKNRYNVSRFATHPRFTNDTYYDNDIALLFVVGPIRFGENIKKAYLAVDDKFKETQSSSDFTVTGFGYITRYGPLSNILMMSRFSLLPQDKCQSIHNITIRDSMFCLEGSGTAACYGDSGGGVIWNGQLVGIVSHIDGSKFCNRPDNPGVYTNIVLFRTWIEYTIKKFLKKCYCLDD